MSGSDRHVRIAIAGSGFGGVGMGIKLKENGIEDFVILERAGDLGGTWRDNSYPGCACDVPSHLYSYSFAPNPNWSNTFSPQAEIWDYLRDCSDRYGVTSHIEYDSEVLGARWDEDGSRWHLVTAKGELTADVFISGVGGLSDPSIPDLPGLDTFEGETFHSATWNHDYDLTGKRVAVVGTGASAIQFVPQIQPKVAKLTLFQRTPPWIVPKRDRPLKSWEHRLYKLFPPAQKAVRAGVYWLRECLLLPLRRPRLNKMTEQMARKHLAEQVADPELRAKLTPNYRMGCKRILPSNDYYPSLTRDNVDLVAAGVTEVRPNAVVGADGSVHEVDAIIFGTGFKVIEFPVADRVFGSDGRSMTDTWAGNPRAYLGTTINGMPNLFTLTGPNTGLGHTSILVMLEAQFDHILRALEYMERHNVAAIEPRAEVEMEFVAEMDRRTQGTVWTSGGCKSWYIDETKRTPVLWPGHTFEFKQRLATFDPGDYLMRPAAPRETAPAEREPLAA